MNIVNSDDKESPPEKKAQGLEELKELELTEIKPLEEKKDTPLEEKPIPPAEVISHSKEITETKPKIKRKPKRRPKPSLSFRFQTRLKNGKING